MEEKIQIFIILVSMYQINLFSTIIFKIFLKTFVLILK
jgi:hypothetical protein